MSHPSFVGLFQPKGIPADSGGNASFRAEDARRPFFGNTGLSLLEIMGALLIVGLAVLPMMRSFSQGYALAGRRIDQEIAVRMAESTMNTLMSLNFDQLDKPANTFLVPLHFEMVGSPNLDVQLPMEPGSGGNPTQGNLEIKTGKSTFRIEATATRVFQGLAAGTAPPSNPNPPILELTYPYNDYAPIKTADGDNDIAPIATGVATYTCPDDFLTLEVKVDYKMGEQDKQFAITACKANLSL